MGVTAYLINGFDVGEEICEITKTITRKDLTSPPDLIRFEVEKWNGITVYRNSINSCVSIQEYGQFNDYKKAIDHFYNHPGKIYEDLYHKCIDQVNKVYQANVKETDWNMLLCVDEKGETQFHVEKQNIVVVDSLDLKKSVYFREFIDCCLIYQSISRIVTFLKNLVFADKLTKFQQFQLSYYSQELAKVKNPDLFLTNRQEIEQCKTYYSQWELKSQIENALSISDQAISNFSFLWDYRNSNSQKFSGLMLSLFTIIVGYPSLKDVIKEFIPQGMIELKICFLCLLVLFIFKMIHLQLKNYKESVEFKKKRRKM